MHHSSDFQDSSGETMTSLTSVSRELQSTDSMVTVPLSDVSFGPKTTDSVCRTSTVLSSPIVEEPQDIVEGEGIVPPNEDTPQRRSNNQSGSTRSSSSTSSRSSGGSSEPGSREGSEQVDWRELEKTEQLESKSDPGDESTALLLARLEQENNALAGNPKSGSHVRKDSRPPSLHQIRKLVDEPQRTSLRFSQLPTPQMTELDFWAALVADYNHTASRLPTLTSNKIRAGVPPPLRGVVWPSLAGARDLDLLDEFARLTGVTSPYEGLIGKDIGRSFPSVEMFRDPNGEGQQMLGRVLRSFSLYDEKIGYCQGLGFVVGPLLMHMSDAEAFCVLVRLMDHYNLRSCFLPTLSGLHLRIYQFQALLSRHLPELHSHLESLKIEPVYVSQWFLSFFGVTCPLPMLLRIYDVLLLEGACETLMRVALSLMQRNQKKLLACEEFEDVMQILLARSIWDTYGGSADALVHDFVSLTSLVTRESLQQLEISYKESQGTSTSVSFPQMQAVASRFLGRLWAGSGSHNSSRSLTLNLNPPPPVSRPSSVVRRTPSKQSMASTLNSCESASDASTAPTEPSPVSTSAVDSINRKTKMAGTSNQDRDLHSQIEDLLTALTDMQREQAALAEELQREREEREEDQQTGRQMLEYLREHSTDDEHATLLAKATNRFSPTASRRVSINQTKHELRDEMIKWKEKYAQEASICKDLSRRIDDKDVECSQMKDELKKAQARLQEFHKDKQRLEKAIQELRVRKNSPSESPHEPQGSSGSSDRGSTGLREFKLCRTASSASTFSKRTSTLGAQALVSNEDSRVVPDEGLLLELVNAKTAEAVARQELEEVKGKLDSLRKLMSCSTDNLAKRPGPIDLARSLTVNSPPKSRMFPNSPTESSKMQGSNAAISAGGFFSGWTKRSASTSPDSR
ncbi:EVI5-like protein [Histoplasma capsulatum var. duboisii H88]|uniref:EVI5-like protein n=3 Tax=Ajellomyces capsulatus TaxID=5037 RepID=A0A8A1L8C6_AJEC8|nr:EVI5-like protein [Histoplasma capsulatum var. duboisii H88]